MCGPFCKTYPIWCHQPFSRSCTKALNPLSSYFSAFTGDGKVYASSLIRHPEFNVTKLKHKSVDEFYDYDVALIKLNRSIKLSSKAR